MDLEEFKELYTGIEPEYINSLVKLAEDQRLLNITMGKVGEQAVAGNEEAIKIYQYLQSLERRFIIRETQLKNGKH